jgi:hypothetical protein
MTRADVEAYADAAGISLVLATGFDDCIVGIGEQFNRAFVVYDRAKVIASLMRDGLAWEEAEEHFGVNIVGAYVGEETPCFLTTSLRM